MRACLVFLTILTLSACGSVQTDAELESYVSAFELEAKRHGVPVKGSPMVFVKKLSTAGICHHGSHIEIAKDWWDTLTEYQREALTFHEQAHCALGLKGHTSKQNTLRSKAIPSSHFYKVNRGSLLVELFDTVQN